MKNSVESTVEPMATPPISAVAILRPAPEKTHQPEGHRERQAVDHDPEQSEPHRAEEDRQQQDEHGRQQEDGPHLCATNLAVHVGPEHCRPLERGARARWQHLLRDRRDGVAGACSSLELR